MEYLSLVLAVLLTLATAQLPSPTVTRCNPSECPPAECADPEYSTDSCCPSCQNSTCQFKGCVNFGAFGPQWRPNPCNICSCVNGQELCTQIECSTPQCFGHPTTTREGECCPVCDFQIPDDVCGVVPVARKALYVALGDKSCREEVITYDCDKKFIKKDGILMKCVPKKKLKSQLFTQSGCPVRKVTFKDVKLCEPKQANPQDLELTSGDCQLSF